MKIKCKKCGETVEVTRLKEYKTCSCGSVGLDYGDGEYYYRVIGSPEDIDGDVTDAPILKDRPVTKVSDDAKVSDPDLEAFAAYFDSISDSFAELSNDFRILSKIIEKRNERYGERH